MDSSFEIGLLLSGWCFEDVGVVEVFVQFFERSLDESFLDLLLNGHQLLPVHLILINK